MAKIVAYTSVSLDGVMQAPGRPDEDPRGGFTHGGWAAPYADPAMRQGMGEDGGALLFGRRTYEDLYGYWPKQTDNPFTPVLEAARKYVVSRTLREPLPWNNSVLLHGDAADAVADLKRDEAGRIMVLGSGELLQTLIRNGLVDEHVVLIHPLVLGGGRRLFEDGLPLTAMTLVDSTTTATGVVMATYARSS
jgi:dihydrofolate reductase